MSRLPAPPARIVVADDETLFRLALCEAARDLFPDAAIREVRTYAELHAALRESPELALLDPRLSGMRGYLSLLALRQRFPATRLFAIAGSSAPGFAQRALALGVAGCVSKRASPRRISRAIARAGRGAGRRPPALRPMPTRERRLMRALQALTPAELAVFALLPDNPSHRHLMSALGIAMPTVKTHMSRILDKLELPNRTAAAVLANRLADLDSPLFAASRPRLRRA